MPGLTFLEGTGAVIRILLSFSFGFTLFHENSWQLIDNPHWYFLLRSCMMYGCSMRIHDASYERCMMRMDACDVHVCQNQSITRELLQDSLHRPRICSLSFLGRSWLLLKDSTQQHKDYVIRRFETPYTYGLRHTKLYSSLSFLIYQRLVTS
jgi:hypothetical protein